MSQRRAAIALAVSGLLFALSVGLLVSRPARAQWVDAADELRWERSFPRQRDLWRLKLDPSQFTQGLPIAGSSDTLSGYYFCVAEDAAGRLPRVITSANPTAYSKGPLWKKAEDGRFAILATSYNSFDWSPGFVLGPGEYVWGGLGEPQPDGYDVALIGYWATPQEQAQLWHCELDGSRVVQGTRFDGEALWGCTFDVVPDPAGRLPVLAKGGKGGSASFGVLYRRNGDGLYCPVVVSQAIELGFSPGIVLDPGEYLVADWDVQDLEPWIRAIVAVGYWAEP
jgi:hypothetical protein